MSRAVVPGAAERCGRALPEEIKALPAGRRSRPLRRRAWSGSEPKRAMATRHPRAAARLWRATSRGAGLLDDSSADVGFSAGWLGADAALLGL